MTIIKLELNLVQFHDDTYRSDEAFRAGQLRAFGKLLSPLHFPTSSSDREDIMVRLTYQALSVLGEKGENDLKKLSIEEQSQIIQRASEHYKRGTELMIPPMVIYDHLSEDDKICFERHFNVRGRVPMFLSDFRASDYDEQKRMISLELKSTASTGYDLSELD